MGTLSIGICRDAGKFGPHDVPSPVGPAADLLNPTGRIVEYATRDQAQNAVATLSNQNLMGRLVYVREVRMAMYISPTDAVLKGSRTGNLSHVSTRLGAAVEAMAAAAP